MIGPDMNGAKARERRDARAACAGLTAQQRVRAADAIAQRLLALPGVGDVRGVLGYAAMSVEADPEPAIRALRKRGVRVAYPRVSGEGLLTLHWAAEDGLVPGYRGILEPGADAPLADPRDIDLAIVPGDAFDPDAYRLGKGGGFYDRLLPMLRPDALTVGIAFDQQVIARVPREAHDVALGAVVTPTRTIVRR